MHWFRLCVDIDQSGNVRGASYELRNDSGCDEIVVLNHTVFGPFDGVEEVAANVLSAVVQRHGLQRSFLVVPAEEEASGASTIKY